MDLYERQKIDYEVREGILREKSRNIEKQFEELKNSILEYNEFQEDYDTDFGPCLEVLRLSRRFFRQNDGV